MYERVMNKEAGERIQGFLLDKEFNFIINEKAGDYYVVQQMVYKYKNNYG